MVLWEFIEFGAWNNRMVKCTVDEEILTLNLYTDIDNGLYTDIDHGDLDIVG